jgi:hypothetical protein
MEGSNEGDLEAIVQSSPKSRIHPEKCGLLFENPYHVNYHFTTIKTTKRAARRSPQQIPQSQYFQEHRPLIKSFLFALSISYFTEFMSGH